MLRYWPGILGALLALVVLLPGPVAADSSSNLRGQASELAQQNQDLAAQSRGVVLELYSLDSQLARERARLVDLRVRTAAVKADLAVARTQLKVARHSLSRVRLSLARRLALLYEQGDSDPLAVVLGASSVADALANLESMNRIADQDRAVIVQTRKASRTATGLTRKLTRKEHDLQALTDEAAQSTLVLEQSRSQKADYLARVTGLQQLNAASIASLQQQALAVESKARELALAASTSPADTHADRPGRRHHDRRRDRLRDVRHDRDRRADRLGRRRRRSKRDPARHAHGDPRLRLRRRSGYRRSDPRGDHRPLVPDGRAGTPLGPPDCHDHAATD